MAEPQQSTPVDAPPAQLVGNAFVPQYYHILHESPGLVHRFYQDISRVGRPEADGQMSLVMTQKAINEKILSMDFTKAEIKTIDSQDSHNGGVIVLVTGHLIGKDDVKRDFTQCFFLAPQEKGYFVLNDIFRYVSSADVLGNYEKDCDAQPNGSGAACVVDKADEQVQLSPNQHLQPENEPHEDVHNLTEEGHGSVVEEDEPVIELVDNAPNPVEETPIVLPPAFINRQEGAQKKSYASIVKVMKENAASLVAAPVSVKLVQAQTERHASPALAPATVADAPSVTSNLSESSIQDSEANGHSIYVRGLPLTATAAQLEEVFKRFGAIKPDSIQVRSHKLQGICYGFIDFEDASAVQSAIDASPIIIDEHKVFVETKRARGSRVSNRGRFPGRGSTYWGDMRGRGNYASSRGYGRNEYAYRATAEFSSRGGSGSRGTTARAGSVEYQRIESSRANHDASGATANTGVK